MKKDTTTINWTDKEDGLIKEYLLLKYPINKISKLLNKSYGSTWRRIKFLNIEIHSPISDLVKETKIFKTEYGNSNLTNVIQKRFNAAKGRAKEKGIEFDITKEFLMELYEKQKGKCFYSDIEMRLVVEERNKNNNDYYSLSIDRINSELGYTKDNTIPCCSVVNIMKNGLLSKEFLNICSKIYLKNTPPLPLPKDKLSRN